MRPHVVRTGLALAMALALAPGAAARAPQHDEDEDAGLARHCLSKMKLKSFDATPGTVDLGRKSVLAWNVKVPSGCPGLQFKVYGDHPAAHEGRRKVQPIANTTYRLRASYNTHYERVIARARVTVNLPKHVSVTSDRQEALFLQAVGTEGESISVKPGVALNLSNIAAIDVAGGVSTHGGRGPFRQGALLYTKTDPRALFILRGDGISFTGLRIRGAHQDVVDSGGNTSSGIKMDSVRNVDIGGNEIYGWKNSGVEVRDNENRIEPVVPAAVRVHDNFIHNNQHSKRLGYGVAVGDGAYAVIDRNVFDYNRHAIAGDGSDGSGYIADDNLVLEHGGFHRHIPGHTFYTHSFDMHGQSNCGVSGIFSDSVFNCGVAGHDVYVRFNSFFYTRDNNFRLRGTPQLKPNGAFVTDNVFVHGKLGDAVTQTESGLYTANNLTGVNGMKELGSCDFDGGGAQERFLATGETWWRRAPIGQWMFLNRSKLRRAQVQLGRFDSFGGCDAKGGGMVFSRGQGPGKPG